CRIACDRSKAQDGEARVSWLREEWASPRGRNARVAPLRHRRPRLQPSFGQISPFERSLVRSVKWKTATMGSFAIKDGVDRLAGADVAAA
ncbi:hypothetical protein, partial [Mesorhizobium sp. CA2]|uniref:hypothetical protein n=1 Tax=Mesorhizobium sp. CA2 TaxID=588498 RepID=UPI001CC9F29F